MSEFETYIRNILNERGINEQDKEDLYYEIKDHLILLKQEYINKGLSEQTAIQSAIKDFGDSNFIGNDLKENLPSQNKYKDFSFIENGKCLAEMFLAYFVFICICVTVLNTNYKSLFFNIGTAAAVALTSFIYTNRKINNKKNKVKNLIICNTIFFIIEKIIMTVFTILAVNIKGSSSDSLFLTISNSYIFNWIYITIYIINIMYDYNNQFNSRQII